jgi:predicted nucleic acid-binding protein
MPVVSNTSPILSLAIIDQLSLLPQQFVEIIIPTEVLAELLPEGETRGVTPIRQALDDGWLRVTQHHQPELARVLALDLDAGEAAAIALAIELGLANILMDESDGRRKAKALALTPIGVIGVLLRAKKLGQLTSVRSTIEALRSQAGFFVADELEHEVLASAGEHPGA